jgi:hypothetical protein
VSGSIRIAKAQYRGDPGLFSFVGKALGGIANVVSKVVPGPIGAIAGLAGKVLSPAARPVASTGKPLNPSINISTMGSAMPVLQMAQPQQQGNQYGLVNINRPQLPMGPGNTTQGGFGGQQSTGAPCERGYHRNKSGYYSKRYGWVEAGSVCVKNRKRNPLNPRALSRSMARLSSAKKAAKFLGAVSIREKGCGCK